MSESIPYPREGSFEERHLNEAIIEEARQRSRRRRLRALLALALITAAAGAFVYARTARNDSEKPAPGAAAAVPLLGTYVSTADVQEVKGAVGFSSPVVVTIDEDRLRWYSACNTYIGDLSTSSGQLMVNVRDATPEGCSRSPSEQERDLVAFFESSPTWKLEGKNRLTLSNDKVQVALQRDASPPSYIQDGS